MKTNVRCRKCGYQWESRVANPKKCPNPIYQAWIPVWYARQSLRDRNILTKPQYRYYKSLAHHAVNAVRVAMKKGVLPRLVDNISRNPFGIVCVDCRALATTYDHRDYFKKLSVDPVCHRCNLRRGPAWKTIQKIKQARAPKERA